MKILHVTKKYPDALGGDAVAVSHLEHQQRKQGHEVFILTHHSPEVVDRQQVTTFGVRIPSSDLDRVTIRRLVSLLSFPFSGYRYLRSIRPDIIHSHSADLGFAISLPARLLGIPVITTCHGVSLGNGDIPWIKRYAEAFFLKHGGFFRIITVDRPSVATLDTQGIPAVYIPNGVDPDFWGRRPEEPPKEDGTITFLSAGRLEKGKGLEYLIEAFVQLRSHIDNVTLQIAGEGSQRRHLEELVVASGISDRVKFRGSRDQEQLRALSLSSDVFVLPSLHEGMPLALLEAWAAGLPVIVTNVGNVPYMCTHLKNAMIVEPGNSTQIFRAMLALAQDRDLRKALGTRGTALVHAEYTWDRIARLIAEIYEGVRRN